MPNTKTLFLHAVAILAVAAVAPAQVQPPDQAETNQDLKIVVLEGEAAINNIRDRIGHPPVIRVEDAEGKPVVGATVNFTLPDLGAGGYFDEGRTALTTTTDNSGQAIARGFRPNNIAGRFRIRVNAAFQTRRAAAEITQVNVAPVAEGSGSKKKYIIAALAAGGVAGLILAVKGGGSSGNTPAAVTPGGGTIITPGSPVFGPPR